MSKLPHIAVTAVQRELCEVLGGAGRVDDVGIGGHLPDRDNVVSHVEPLGGVMDEVGHLPRQRGESWADHGWVMGEAPSRSRPRDR